MNLHEHQGKAIFRDHNIPVPEGYVCFSAVEAADNAKKLGGDVWVVKAQIHAGGRGKGGGVKVCRSIEEVTDTAEQMLGMQLVTPQTGPAGQTVRRLLVEKGAAIANELYLSMVVDRKTQKVALMASSAGGMDIEEVAAKEPEKIKFLQMDPKTGVDRKAATQIAGDLGIADASLDEFADLTENLYATFKDTDATLLEINPLVILTDNRLLALDAKFNLDDNALFRHPDLVELRDVHEENEVEREAAKHDLSYISLDGNIGCMVNGAGLAMATMDAIKLHGGNPANFLDVGGGATTEKVTAAFKLMLTNPSLKAILVNIFGGIMRCDIIAEGIVAAASQITIGVPLIVRLEGTNVKEGQKILADSGLAITTATNMDEAATQAVAATR